MLHDVVENHLSVTGHVTPSDFTYECYTAWLKTIYLYLTITAQLPKQTNSRALIKHPHFLALRKTQPFLLLYLTSPLRYSNIENRVVFGFIARILFGKAIYTRFSLIK